MKKSIFFWTMILWSGFAMAQEAPATEEPVPGVNIKGKYSVVHDSIRNHYPNPMKASIYSALIPGMGQIYNKKWWKAPIVWGLIGTGVGFVIFYDNQYQDFRSAYLAELNGQPHQYSNLNLGAERLALLQDDQKRNRDYAIVLTALGYILNIIDAAVDAHLYDARKDPDLSIEPIVIPEQPTNRASLGLSLKFNF